MSEYTSGFSREGSEGTKQRHKEKHDEMIESIDQTEMDDKKKFDRSRNNQTSILNSLECILGPLVLTILSLMVRFSGIDRNATVVWDEAHFGKFGSYYIKHEFYHDVHPPLGKMLIALSEWLAGFDGDFAFDSNVAYPDHINFTLMRQFNATFSALCTPIAYFTAKWMGFNTLTVYLVSLMVALEHSYIVLSKFILLDSMLLFFTMTTFACMAKLYTLRKHTFTKKWTLWLLLTGLSVGCVCSVKWVGLFITVVVGLFTVVELWSYHCDTRMTWKSYSRHWLIRIIYLIVIPFLVYLYCFKIHFSLLYKSGSGDASTNTLFQINLEGTQIENSPRDVMYGSVVTVRSHGLSPNLLHSHVQKYPAGSEQNQVTGYGYADENNHWIIKFINSSALQFDDNGETVNGQLIPVKDGDELRLIHKNTDNNLHSHEIGSHVSKNNWEVSGYGSSDLGDDNDNWIIEIVDQLESANSDFPKEDNTALHPVSTFFRLKHKNLGCYLTSTGFAYPAWGFKQSEVVCKESWSSRDKSTWWNIEEHWNDRLDINEDYLPPKSKFWTDFILTNFAMASSNNALIPDENIYDNLASKAWEWPTLHKGLRMCNWSHDMYRYYLLGSPFNTWLSSLSLILSVGIIIVTALKWKRQLIDFTEDDAWKLAIQLIFPLISWATHFVPFVTMGRVTYVHHYLPALYFAILIFGFVVDSSLKKAGAKIRYPAYFVLFSGCVYVYILFSPLCQGLRNHKPSYMKMKWLSTWDFLL